MPLFIPFMMYGLVVIMAVVFTPMTIECQRAVLLEERPSFSRMFQFDRRAGRCIAVGLLYLHMTMWP
ncbi:MAG: hypothetical protein ACREEV_05520, partial [Dongiaceae bacterium]